MNPATIVAILRILYPFIRPILRRTIDDPQSIIDDQIIDVFDMFFGYEYQDDDITQILESDHVERDS